VFYSKFKVIYLRKTGKTLVNKSKETPTFDELKQQP
jgi:hypothetical protein